MDKLDNSYVLAWPGRLHGRKPINSLYRRVLKIALSLFDLERLMDEVLADKTKPRHGAHVKNIPVKSLLDLNYPDSSSTYSSHARRYTTKHPLSYGYNVEFQNVRS